MKEKKIKSPVLNNYRIDHPLNVNFTYLHMFGFSVAICLVVQILTGIFLAMHYTSHIDVAFLSIKSITEYLITSWPIKYLYTYGPSIVYFMIYIYILRILWKSSIYKGHLLGCLSFYRIVPNTKWDIIINTLRPKKDLLLGFDSFDKSNRGAEWISHFSEIEQLEKYPIPDHIYLPISTNQLLESRPYLRKSNIHDGLIFNTSSDSIVEKIEFKSKLGKHFGPTELSKLDSTYTPLGLNRLDLCCANSDSYGKTVDVVEKYKESVSINFNPVDFSEIFYKELKDDDFLITQEHVNKIIDSQIELKPTLEIIWDDLLVDPLFFPQI